MKIRITENKIRKILNESIKKVLKEYYNSDDYNFNDNKELHDLVNLVMIFTGSEIMKEDYSEDAYFGDFIDGCIKLYKMSVEYQDYVKYNFAELYRDAVAKGDENSFWYNDNVDNYEYLDNYLYRIEDWDESMPSPEVVKNAIEMFAEWLKEYTEYEIENYSDNKWRNYKNYINKINGTI
jgi:hypothetical protein